MSLIYLLIHAVLVSVSVTIANEAVPHSGVLAGIIVFFVGFLLYNGEVTTIIKEMQVALRDSTTPQLKNIFVFSKGIKKLKYLIEQTSEFSKKIFRDASGTANQILLASKNLSIQSRELSKMSKDQADNSQAISSAIIELQSTIGMITQNTQKTSDDAKKIETLTEDGHVKIEKLVKVVSSTSAVFEELVTSMEQFNKSAEKISEVIEIIKNITMQTKLLSFNAAVEAARAGEAGRGFSIVADEITKLAEQTEESAAEIANTVLGNKKITGQIDEKIQIAQKDIEQSTSEALSVKDSFGLVKDSVSEITNAINLISVSTSEQREAINDISDNIQTIVSASGKIFEKAEESLKLGKDVYDVSEQLETQVNKVKRQYFTLVPFESPIAMVKKFTPMAEFVSQIINDDLLVRLGHDYEQTIEDAGSRAPITYQTPSTYVEAREKYGVIPLVCPLNKGEKYYQTAIVVKSDSEISNIVELKSKSFAFGDIKSMGSKAMPEHMLKQAGVSTDQLAKYDYLGSHDNVAKAVAAGDFVAGGLMKSVAEKYVSEGSIKIIATSDDIPQFPICASPNIPEDLRNKIIKALCNLDPEDEVLEAFGPKITGFAPVSDDDYNIVRSML